MLAVNASGFQQYVHEVDTYIRYIDASVKDHEKAHPGAVTIAHMIDWFKWVQFVVTWAEYMREYQAPSWAAVALGGAEKEVRNMHLTATDWRRFWTERGVVMNATALAAPAVPVTESLLPSADLGIESSVRWAALGLVAVAAIMVLRK